MTVYRNTNEGITPSGTTVSVGNSGGVSGNAWDATSIGVGATDISDNTHAHSGSLSNQIVSTATAATSYNQWDVTIGSLVQHWFELYLYATANPPASHRLYSVLQTSVNCFGVRLGTNGIITCLDANSVAIPLMVTTNPIPLNKWFRIEGFMIGDALVGQVELKLFANADDVTPLETDTSAANVNTTGASNRYRFGLGSNVANIGPYWQDDVAVSTTGYLGPYLPSLPISAEDIIPVNRRRASIRRRRYIKHLIELGRL